MYTNLLFGSLFFLHFSSAFACFFDYADFAGLHDPYGLVPQATEKPSETTAFIKAPHAPIGAEKFIYKDLAQKLALIDKEPPNPKALSSFYRIYQSLGFSKGTMPRFLNWYSKNVIGHNLSRGLREGLLFLDRAQNPRAVKLKYSIAVEAPKSSLMEDPLLSAKDKETLASMIEELQAALFLHYSYFDPDFDPRIISSGFSFWVSALQYEVHKNLITKRPYNENIFFLEWLAAIYLEQDPGLKKARHDLVELTKYLSFQLKTRESKYSAMSRLREENDAYQEYLDKYIDTDMSIGFHKDQAAYWNHIQNRAKKRLLLEKSIEAQSISEAPRRAELSLAVALFTLYRITSTAHNPYNDALLSLAELANIAYFDLRLPELRRIYKIFL
jgi:hypothetical protein